jgi:hypothetical protein
MARVSTGGNPEDQRRLRRLESLKPASVIGPVNFRLGDQLGVAEITENSRDGLRPVASGESVGELVKVRAGDLVNPLVLKALKGIPLELERHRDLEESQDRLYPGGVRLSPQVGQHARQCGLNLGL